MSHLDIPTRAICENSIMRDMAERAAAVAVPPAAEIPGQTEPIEMQCTLMVSLMTSFGLPAAMPTREHVANWLVADGQVFEHHGSGLDFEVCAKHADADECDESCVSISLTYRASIVTVEEVS